MKHAIPLFLLLLIAFVAAGQSNSQIVFEGINGVLLDNIRKNVRLVSQTQNGESLSNLDRQRLESQVEGEIIEALEPYGYYLASVDSDLSQAPSRYVYKVTRNKPVRIAQIKIKFSDDQKEPELFDNWRQAYPLKPGDILSHIAYEVQKKRLLSLALQNGYFDAKFTRSEMVINEQRTSADIFIEFEIGRHYKVDDVLIEWDLGDLDYRENKYLINEALLASSITLEKDDFYTAEAANKTRENLIATSYFSSVDINVDSRDQQNGDLAVVITLTPNKRKAYNFAVGAGTNTGPRGSIGYENRRINSAGHTVNARVGGSEIERTAIVNYRIPLKRSVKDNLNFFTTLEEEVGDTRRFKLASIGSEWSREWDKALLKFGLTASREKYDRIEDQLTTNESKTDLLMPSMTWDRTKSDDLYFPNKGWSMSATLRVASEDVFSDINLAQMIFTGKYLRPFGSGRIRLRFKLGASLIEETIDLPESLGFLGGGDDSIRGYKYESIGVTRSGVVNVGKNLNVASFEYEHPIKNGFSLAGFFDVGDAFDSSPDYKKGAGLGLRWRLPFGALRLDAASALDLEGEPWRLHFSFGTDL